MKFVFITFLLITQSVFAAPLCKSLFAEPHDAAYYKRGERITEVYPLFKDLLLDPQAYFNRYQELFKKQKAKDPSNPYEFDFSDWGMPLFQDMKELLEKKRQTLEEKYNSLKSNSLKAKINKKKIADLEIGFKYFDLLQKELDQHLKRGRATYKQAYELSYFYSRAIGMFDISVLKLLSLKEKWTLKLDMVSEGFETLTPQQELDRYLKRDVKIFDKDTPIATWQAASKPFADAVMNQNELELLILPTTRSLGNDIFLHLLSSEIYLVGVADEPIPADGYSRPGGIFLVHDYRHASFMYYRNLLYRQQFGLTRAQVDKLSRMMAEFSEQLDEALEKIPDQNLASAVRYFMFNQHHDGGYHYSPMNYETNNAYHAPFILYAQLVFAGQYREAKSIFDLPNARKWLESFWLPRVDQEKKWLEEFRIENEKKK